MNKTKENHTIEKIILEQTLVGLCTSVSNIICTPTSHLTQPAASHSLLLSTSPLIPITMKSWMTKRDGCHLVNEKGNHGN